MLRDTETPGALPRTGFSPKGLRAEAVFLFVAIDPLQMRDRRASPQRATTNDVCMPIS